MIAHYIVHGTVTAAVSSVIVHRHAFLYEWKAECVSSRVIYLDLRAGNNCDVRISQSSMRRQMLTLEFWTE